MLRLGTYHRYGSIRIDVLFNCELHGRMHSSACCVEHDNELLCIGHQVNEGRSFLLLQCRIKEVQVIS